MQYSALFSEISDTTYIFCDGAARSSSSSCKMAPCFSQLDKQLRCHSSQLHTNFFINSCNESSVWAQRVQDILRGCFCPAVSVSGVLFITAVRIFGTWSLHQKGRRREATASWVSWMRSWLLHVSQPAGLQQGNIKQVKHLFPGEFLAQSLQRWKEQKVFFQRKIAPRSKTWRWLNDGFWFSECSEGLRDAEFKVVSLT